MLFNRDWLDRRCCLTALAGIMVVGGWSGGIVRAEPQPRMVADDLDFRQAGRAGRGNKLGHATVTQINNDVRYQPGDGAERRAAVRDIVRGSDLVRTGLKSQAELEFEDRTITRLGSNTAFTFDPDKREFQLHKGLMLFDMPKTAGGGKIITPACTAAIEGTAGMVSYRSAPKILCLAGIINVTDPRGKLLARVMPGQLFIVGVTKYPVSFLLSGTKSGKLMQGGLPNNTQEFSDSSDKQLGQMLTGQLQVTPLVIINERLDVFVETPTPTTPSKSGTEAQVAATTQKLGIITDPVVLDRRSTTDYTVNPPVMSGPWGALAQVIRPDGTRVWDFGAHNVIKTEDTVDIGEDAYVAAHGAGVHRIEGRTTGYFKIVNDWNSSNGQPTSSVTHRSFYASDIQIDNSLTEAHGSWTYGPATLNFISTGNLRVDYLGGGWSAFGFTAGTLSGVNIGGTLHMESGGTLSFTGGNSSQLDLVMVGAMDVGGTVEMISTGTSPTAGVFIQNAHIDATHPNVGPFPPHVLSSTPAVQGGTVTMDGKVQVDIRDTTTVNADGATAGSIHVASQGTASAAGSVAMNASSPSGYIRLSAQDSATIFNALTANGNADILGAPRTVGNETIQILAGGPTDAGKISIAAIQALNIVNAQLNASAASGSAYAGGFLRLQAPSILVQNSGLYANGGSSGIAGRIELGGFASTSVSVLNSMLSTMGFSAGLVPAAGATFNTSGIYISGASVNLGGSTLVPGPTAIVHVYTDHFGSLPSSGAYQVLPLASAPR